MRAVRIVARVFSAPTRAERQCKRGFANSDESKGGTKKTAGLSRRYSDRPLLAACRFDLLHHPGVNITVARSRLDPAFFCKPGDQAVIDGSNRADSFAFRKEIEDSIGSKWVLLLLCSARGENRRESRAPSGKEPQGYGYEEKN